VLMQVLAMLLLMLIVMMPGGRRALATAPAGGVRLLLTRCDTKVNQRAVRFMWSVRASGSPGCHTVRGGSDGLGGDGHGQARPMPSSRPAQPAGLPDSELTAGCAG
jgi:hypothetical protein